MPPNVLLSYAGAVAVIEIDNAPVNAASQQVRQGLADCLRNVAADGRAIAVVLCGAGPHFMAGADIAEFDIPIIKSPDPNDLYRLIEQFNRPVIAALHGCVLGGGLELALACHYRIALNGAMLGLPDVRLGVLPGGGTQRLPRVIGIDAALSMMTSGATMDARAALACGLVDQVVEADLRARACELATSPVAARQPLPVTSALPLSRATLAPGCFDRWRGRLAPVATGGRAGHAIVGCVEDAVPMPFDAALTRERTAFESCRDSDQSRAMRHAFFAQREAACLPDLPRDLPLRQVKAVGVVGAGAMGSGIAISFANAGMAVTMIDIDPGALAGGLAKISGAMLASVSKGGISIAEAHRRIGLVSGTLDYAALAACDLVIEAAFEDMHVKRAIFRHLGRICKSGAIIASNTSTLDIDALARASGRPADFLGMHFFGPAHVVKLLEVVRGKMTASTVLATTMALARRIGKSPVVSGVCHGFIGNRMLDGYLREADFLLLEGATPRQIDGALEAAGMTMGPCRMSDMAGVDIAARDVLERRTANTLPGDPRYRAVLRRLHALGRHGEKSALGYYRYDGQAALDDPALLDICVALAREHGVTRRGAISDKEIVERCLYPLINEGARILDDGIAYRASDIDVVWVQGFGFPAWKGGPMHMADALGAATVCNSITSYAARCGNGWGYWNIAPLLARLAACGGKFADTALCATIPTQLNELIQVPAAVTMRSIPPAIFRISS